MYYLLDLERSITSGIVTYWNPAKRGYTTDIKEAGRYTKEQAEEIVESDFDNRTLMFHESVAERLKERHND